MRRKLVKTLGSSGGLLGGSGWPMDVKIIFLLWLWRVEPGHDLGPRRDAVPYRLDDRPVHILAVHSDASLTGVLSAIAGGAPARSGAGAGTRRRVRRVRVAHAVHDDDVHARFAMVIPYQLEVGNTNWTLPDDGLDPEWDRRLVKMQVVTTVLAAIAIVVQTWWK